MSTLSIISGVLLLAGLAMLIRGRRVGDTPYCRKCGYNLTALLVPSVSESWSERMVLAGGRCSECGAEATADNVLIGVRKRRARLWAPGLMLTLLCTTFLGLQISGTLKQIVWYRHYPKFMLVNKAMARDIAAIKELQRRFEDGVLTREDVSGLIPQALITAGQARGGPVGDAWMEFLASMDVAGLLSETQRDQFCDAMIPAEVLFRPRIRQGEELWPWLEYSLHTPRTFAGTCELKLSGMSVGPPRDDGFRNSITLRFPIGPWQRRSQLFSHGAGLGDGVHTYIRSNDGDVSVLNLWQQELRPGIQTARIDLTLDLNISLKNGAALNFSKHLEPTKKVEVLPTDAPDTVELVADPSLAEEFKRAISISPYSLSRSDVDEPRIRLTLQGRLPMDGAFQLIAVSGDQEYELGRFVLRKNGSRQFSGLSLLKAPPVESFVPILRTNVEAARATHDVFRIWDGEIRFDPIRLKEEENGSGE